MHYSLVWMNTTENDKKFIESIWCAYILSVLSAWNAEIVTYPLDLVKTRLQIQGEIDSKKNLKIIKTSHRGALLTCIGIVKEEGFFKLWQGVSAILLRHLTYSGCRMVIYKSIKQQLQNDEKSYFPLWKSAICGATAGGMGQLVASPMDLLKVQMQMDGKRKLMGLKPRHKNVVDAFINTYRAAGIPGLWKGWVPNVQRAALVNIGDLTGYDYSKRFVLRNTTLEDNHYLHILCSFIAGFVASVLGTPADVIKTRIMNQPIDNKGRGLLYKSSTDCLKKSIRNEGFLSLYKGFIPNWMKLAPWSLIFWISYEHLSYIIGREQF